MRTTTAITLALLVVGLLVLLVSALGLGRSSKAIQGKPVHGAEWARYRQLNNRISVGMVTFSLAFFVIDVVSGEWLPCVAQGLLTALLVVTQIRAYRFRLRWRDESEQRAADDLVRRLEDL